MRKLVIIILTFAFLLAHTPFREVLKLPMLVQQYQSKKQCGCYTNFLAFVQQYYWHYNSPDDEEACDNMASKSVDERIEEQITFLPSEFVQYPALLVKGLSKQQADPYQFTILSSFLHTIWRPPCSLS